MKDTEAIQEGLSDRAADIALDEAEIPLDPPYDPLDDIFMGDVEDDDRWPDQDESWYYDDDLY